MQIPNDVSKYSNIRHIIHNRQTGSKKDGSFNRNSDKTKMIVARLRPRLHANCFWMAP